MIVADASVVLKWLLSDGEADRETALLLRQRHLQGEISIAAPDLLLYEVANVLLMKREDPQAVFEGFQELYSADIRLHSFEPPEFFKAAEAALRYKITGYDACYVALAQILRCRLVTADERLLSRLKGVPHVLHLREIAR